MSHIASLKTFAAAAGPFATTLGAAGRWLDETLLALHAAVCADDEGARAGRRADAEDDDR